MSRRHEAWSVEAHLAAYARGYFPMADERDRRVYWYNPDPRAVLPLSEEEGLHVPRTVRRAARTRGFLLRSDAAFREVIRACAAPRNPGDGVWIDATLEAWYARLHEAGHAHSVEAYLTDPDTGDPRLVGGLYGISIGAAFFAESMFHRPRPRLPSGSRHPLDGTDASNVCLLTLVEHLRALRYELLDVQIANPHTQRFGVREIEREEFLDRLELAVEAPERWAPLGDVAA